ncbi:hypothetical protein WG909_12825 [Peptostreptococcaceae bacterium AGR-M142]
MNSAKKVMVCVTKQKTCERLIKYASKIAGKDGDLHVVHVTTKTIPVTNSTPLQHLFNASKKYYAQMSILHSTNILNTITDYAVKNDIQIVVMGESLERTTETNMTHKIESSMKIKGIKPLTVPLSYNCWDKNIV